MDMTRLVMGICGTKDLTVALKQAREMNTLKEAANSSKSHVLSTDVLTGMLKAHVEWANRRALDQGQDPPTVITYECKRFDFDALGVVVKILNRSYVDEAMVLSNVEALNYFGPFDHARILVNLAIKNESSSASSSKSKPKSRKTKEDQSAASERQESDDSFDKLVIVCENEARMRVVADVARQLQTPYVPFKIMFVEGVLESGGSGGFDTVEIPMTPAACLVGDYSNLFSLRRVNHGASLHRRSLEEIHTKYNVWEKSRNVQSGKLMKDPGTKIVYMYEIAEELDDDLEENGYGLGLVVAFNTPEETLQDAILESILSRPYDGHRCEEKLVLLPGVDACGRNKKKGDTPSLFHRNEKDKVAFTKDEAELASKHIASIGLDERVKLSLQKKKFDLPQESGDVDANFCNEQVYGKVNILWVCGVLRLEATQDEAASAVAPASGENYFDAWPSSKAKARSEMAKAHAKRMQEMLESGQFD